MKQVFQANMMLRRVVCAVLVAVMVFAMIPLSSPKAAAAMDGKTLYFKPNGGIGDNAWYFAHFFNDGGSQTIKMTENSDGNHYCTVPNGYTKVVFGRMNPDYSNISWEKDQGLWNKTNDLSLPTNDNNCYQATGWSGEFMTGSWTKIADTNTPSTPTGNVTAYLAGSWTDWGTNKITMTGTDGENASVTVQLEPGTYYFKIVDKGGAWHGNSGNIADTTTASSNAYWTMNSNDNCTLTASGGSYTFTYNVKNNTLKVTHTKSGGGDDVKLYVGTTFYDYRSDHELGGGKLSDRGVFDFNDGKGWDCWYIFRNLNKELNSYYSGKNVMVPIYMGHFQPNSNYYDFKDFEGVFGYTLYGYNKNDENKFMSVNNSQPDVNGDRNGHIESAAWGIVAPALNGGKLMTSTNSGTVEHPLFDQSFLNKTYNGRTLAKTYTNVQFPFTKVDPDNNGIEYWVFNSENTTLKMAENDEGYYLSEVSNPGDGFKNRKSDGNIADNGKFGFFPFNTGSETNASQYNYGYGMRLDIPFNLTSDGKLADKYGDKQDIIFKFSGDDDVWVFIDGVLVLDIGGSHGKVTGEINFGNMTATVSNVKASLGNTNPADADNNHSNGYQTKFTLPKEMAGKHTLTMFYMERGMWESNMSISFNFIPDSSLWAKETSFTVLKQWNVAQESVIPASVTVQLQRRLQGTTEWTEVEKKTLTSADVSTQRVANTWEYNWTNLPNFEGETLYEYRVVELNAQGNVLSNGEKNGETMVAYGDVAGSGATGYTQIISNNQVANPVVVVIDFGLSVDVTVADSATLVGVGNTLKLPVGNSPDRDANVVDSVEGKHGVATVYGDKIRYTPNDMMMDSADNIGFCIQYSNGTYNYSTLTVIPAANIYYEDEEKFMHFENADGATDNFGKWTIDTDDNAGDKTQAEDRPGTAHDTLKDANNVYGYDQAYDSFEKYSLGSAHMVTVNAATGTPTTAPSVSFSFTGTGFDVVSLTDSRSGAIMVEVKQNGTTKVSYIVDNYYGMIYDENNDSWTADKNSTGCLYQVPVIKVDELEYGTYDVTIKAAYLKALDKTEAEGYTIWLDAIRIYNPALNDKTSNDAYESDGESNPHLTTLKKLLVEPNFNAYDKNNADVEINGVVYIDGISGVVSMAKYANQGPNNETYLKNGNAVTFKFRIEDVVNPNNGPQIDLQIGAKLAMGNEATLKVGINNSTTSVTTVKTATNMFYKLPGITWKKVNGGWESCPIVFSCVGGSGDILSLTDLKLTGPDADVATYVSAANNTTNNRISTFVDNECYFAAVNVMSASEVKPVTLTGKNFSLSFEDEILVNFYYAVSDVTNITEHGMLVFNSDPGAADITKADQKYDAPVYVESDDLYACTTSGIAAKEMGDSRYYCAYAKLSDGTVVYSDLHQYSPKQYAMSRLEKSEDENLKALCVAMLNYGAAAQTYFGYKTDALMNADLTAEQQALVAAYNADLFSGAVAADPAKVGSFTATETGFSRRSASVSFEGAFALNFYFQLDREDSEVDFYYWTKETYDSVDELTYANATGTLLLQPDENGVFHGPITGIAAKDLDDTIYVAATYTVGGEVFCTGIIPYSVSTYCMKHANGNMGQLAQATAMYGYYAESYFDASSQELI